MAQLPGRRTKHLIALALVFALLAPAMAGAVALEGTWHVLVHYTDDNSQSPDQARWNDRVWGFQRKGSRIQWTEYPIVVFGDDKGRFERRGTGQYARVLGAWEPSEAQLGDIADGLKTNSRGMKKKTLRGSDEGGWATTSRARATSASMITYQENWSVESMLQLPVFTQEDQMGSPSSETLDGVTRYTTEEVSADGTELRGRFERDGSRHGTFAMRRAGKVQQLEEKTQKEIQAQAFRRGFRSSQVAKQEVRKQLDAELKKSDVKLEDDQLDEVVEEVMKMVEEGLAPDLIGKEVQRSIQRRVGAPEGS